MSLFIRSVKPLKSKSFFLFGARGVGKSTFIQTFLSKTKHRYIDLLDPELEDKYSRQPSALLEELTASQQNYEWVVIDEVQKCPPLLNIVQKLIVEQKLKFILSGSSARRLKQRGVNLLAGRALNEFMFPLTHIELGESFDLQQVLETGTLPEVRTAENKDVRNAFLRSYALNYISSEIQLEQWVKKLAPFRKFLEVAAQMNTKILNYSKIAKDIGVDPNTVQSYFEILEDTLVGIRLPAFDRSIRKQQRQAPKFYFFDLGVKRALDRTLDVPLKPQTSAYGDAFEHFIVLEIYRLISYARKDYQLFYMLTKDDAEIDIIVDRPGKPAVLVEIKSKAQVFADDARHLHHFRDDFKDPMLLVLSNDPVSKDFGGALACHWREGLKKIMDS